MTQPLRRNGLLVANILRGCEGKRRYPDEFVCKAAGQIEQERAPPDEPVKLYMYPCTICKGWHLTRSKQSKDRYDVDYVYPRTRRGA